MKNGIIITFMIDPNIFTDILKKSGNAFIHDSGQRRLTMPHIGTKIINRVPFLCGLSLPFDCELVEVEDVARIIVLSKSDSM